jgi:molybdopterin-containing oxidoreductase family iron-sulfur binding subunit
MHEPTYKTYWKNLADRRFDAAQAAPEREETQSFEIDRRRFLEAAGFTLTLAATSGCDSMRARKVVSLPLVEQSHGMIAGRMRSYASTCAGCSAACGLLVGVRDGRPLKMEGMKEHPLSRGGLCAVGQAMPLSLYDSHRLDNPLAGGEKSQWTDVDREILSKLAEIKTTGGAVRVVTETVSSPTLQRVIDGFLATFADGKHITADTVSYSAILDAHERTHAVRVLPHYRLDRAEVIVSFDADFLGTWLSPVEFTAAWQTRRAPTEKRPHMSHHVQFEGRLSLTGSNADRRYMLRPEEEGLVLSQLAAKVGKLAGRPLPNADPSTTLPLAAEDLTELATRLWKARGKSVILSGSQDIASQVLVNYLNDLLGNYGKTVDIQTPSWQKQGSDKALAALLQELKAGKVSALFVAGTDLTHNLPNRGELAAAIARVPLVVSFAERENDFSELAHYVCPDLHPLESWFDAEPVSGLASLAQPTLRPLRNTRSILESFSIWSLKPASALQLVQETWREQILARATDASDFTSFWDKSLRQGFVDLRPTRVPTKPFDASTVTLIDNAPVPDDLSLVLHPSVGILDSRHAHNAWLQELPDPITKGTWDNYLSISPQLAESMNLVDGDIVQVETIAGDVATELPAYIQPGQQRSVLSIALGYGVKGTDRFANIGPQWFEARPTVAKGERVGKNAAGFLLWVDGSLRRVRSGVRLTKTGAHRELATTQEHHSINVPASVAPYGANRRDVVEETTLAAFVNDARAGSAKHHHFDGTLWPKDHPQAGHHWGMAIDLNKCSGCSACVIACQSENNVPVVGRDEVRRQREMHWMRIDRYYSGDGEHLDVSHQPMMCQHCDNAPCETVCPVLATVSSSEGLNQQVYNRCVGTRYCANNCPYKVRRFNWFNYPSDDKLQNLVLNPDVTVRTRGVMEKCSLCVQRIQEGKIEAKQMGLPVVDGAIETACQQSCPARAIVFGDMNDPASEVHAAMQDPRRYHVLEELNVRPSVGYLRIVRNRDEEAEHV